MQIELESGRLIRLAHLEQYRTYAGLLCGQPSSESNDEKIRRTVEQAMASHSHAGTPQLIAPARKFVRRRTPDGIDGEWLGAVTCIAVFDSDAISVEEPYSSLAIVWFQEEFALPIDASVVAAIRKLDWDRIAGDWCW